MTDGSADGVTLSQCSDATLRVTFPPTRVLRCARVRVTPPPPTPHAPPLSPLQQREGKKGGGRKWSLSHQRRDLSLIIKAGGQSRNPSVSQQDGCGTLGERLKRWHRAAPALQVKARSKLNRSFPDDIVLSQPQTRLSSRSDQVMRSRGEFL